MFVYLMVKDRYNDVLAVECQLFVYRYEPLTPNAFLFNTSVFALAGAERSHTASKHKARGQRLREEAYRST